MELPFAEAWKIKMVEPIKKSTREEREQWLEEGRGMQTDTDRAGGKKARTGRKHPEVERRD